MKRALLYPVAHGLRRGLPIATRSFSHGLNLLAEDSTPSSSRGGSVPSSDPYQQNEAMLRGLSNTPRANDDLHDRSSKSDRPSKGMPHEAESSTAAWLDSLHKQRVSKLAKQAMTDPADERRTDTTSTPISARPPHISDRLSPAASWAPPPVRSVRAGSRQRRSEGQTPQEQATFNEVIADLFDHLEEWGDLRSGSSPRVDPYALTSVFGSRPSPTAQSGVQVYGPKVGMRRLLERAETEEDDAAALELDEMIEEVSTTRTDAELLELAKERILKPQAAEDGSISYPRIYPRILAHVIKTMRANYSNPHLALALFHHARTVSVESYLAGCLAPAYNELLKLRWESFRDLEGVEQGVREMEVNGVGWDRGTQRVVSRVVEEAGKEVLEHDGERVWGKDVYALLSRLEARVQKDVLEQERFAEMREKEKRAARTREQPRRLYLRPERGGAEEGIRMDY